MKTKICSKCNEEKEIIKFHLTGNGIGKRRAECADCCSIRAKNRYKKIKNKYKAKYSNYRKIIREKYHKLKQSPCVDCGGKFHPAVMDFDHIDSSKKIASVARIFSHTKNWDNVIEEAKKCELVCANCHRIRTLKRRNDICKCEVCREFKVS